MRLNSNGSDKARQSIQGQVKRIFAAGRITRHEHLALTSALLKGQSITEHDRRQINEILESVQLGKLELID